MNIHIYNYARSFSITYWTDDKEWEDPFCYSNVDDAVAAAKEEIDVRQQAFAAHIYDTETGELYVTCTSDNTASSEEDHSEWDDDDPYDVEWDDYYWDDGCPIDDVDESNYDPYLGCDVYETEPMCDMW
jgi:hypothetical protein